jgi:hypothetical protein
VLIESQMKKSSKSEETLSLSISFHGDVACVSIWEMQQPSKTISYCLYPHKLSAICPSTPSQ